MLVEQYLFGGLCLNYLKSNDTMITNGLFQMEISCGNDDNKESINQHFIFLGEESQKG